MANEHNFTQDLDGQVTCSVCGARDDEMVSKSQLRRITVQNPNLQRFHTPTCGEGVVITHNCNFELDLDGQVTCSVCGARHDKTNTVQKSYCIVSNKGK